MKPDKLSGYDFYTQEKCVKLTDEIMKEAADVRYYQNHGFNFWPSFYMRQYFVNTPDGNAEFVLSFAERVPNCSDTTLNKHFKETFHKKIKELVKLTKVK